MKIVLISDTFPPFRTSGAVQIRDLSREFVKQGHHLTLLLPCPGQKVPWSIEYLDGIQLVRLKAPKTKDLNYIYRTLNEIVMPFLMLRSLQKSPLAKEKWDGVIWYAPSIFLAPLASFLKKKSSCKGYLIIRDIFPEWAVDVGLMRPRGLPYKFFNAIAQYQYSVADIIGVQTEGNVNYFNSWKKNIGCNLEILYNWLDKPINTTCTLKLEKTKFAGCKVFVYAGNMGVAQGLDIIFELAFQLRFRNDIGFLFVGRGSEVVRLKKLVKEMSIENVLFFDEIDPDEISDLYSQCIAGIVSLDSRHKSHNIPGKFLTYIQNGLPVLANINKGNDLAKIIREQQVGQVSENNDIRELFDMTLILLEQIEIDINLSSRCLNLFERDFTVQKAVSQISNNFL
jgi:glycosyltransferase involved in cell wall biosynthesis